MPEKSTVEPKNTSRLLELDGIRGAACLFIVIYHFFGLAISGKDLSPVAFQIAYQTKRFLQTGWTGVDLFFVLSGFLIGGILLQHRDAKNYFQVFYIRRFCRILPLYVLVLIVFFIVVPLVSWPMPPEPRDRIFATSLPTLSYLTFTQNFAMATSPNDFGNQWINITWSLAIEEQFYILLPLLIRLVPVKKLPLVLVGFIVAAPMLRMAAFSAWGVVAPYVLMPTRADALMLGVLIAYLMQYSNLEERLRSRLPLLYFAFAILIAGAFYLTLRHPHI